MTLRTYQQGNPLRDEPEPSTVALVKRFGWLGLVVSALWAPIARRFKRSPHIVTIGAGKAGRQPVMHLHGMPMPRYVFDQLRTGDHVRVTYSNTLDVPPSAHWFINGREVIKPPERQSWAYTAATLLGALVMVLLMWAFMAWLVAPH